MIICINGMPVEVESKPVERNNYADRSWGKSEFPFSLNYAQSGSSQPQQRQPQQNKAKVNRRSKSKVTPTPKLRIDTNNPPQLFGTTGWGPMG